MAKIALLAPANVTSTDDANPTFQLGDKVVQFSSADGYKVFQYVKFDNGASNVAAANGGVATWQDQDAYIVTSDFSGGLGQGFPAGVFVNAITDGQYGFIQVAGRHSTIKTDGSDDFVANDSLIVDPTTDLACHRIAAGTAPTYRALGVALAADIDANDTVDGLIVLADSQ